MPRAPKTRAAKLTRHLDGLAVFANTETTGDTHKKLARAIDQGRQVLQELEREDAVGDLLGELREVTESMRDVRPEMAEELISLVNKYEAEQQQKTTGQSQQSTG